VRHSAFDLSLLVEELSGLLTDGFIQKIHQTSPDVVTLDIRQPGHTFSLLISIHPQTGRLHLIRHRLANPPTPFPFCQFLRSTIQGTQLQAIEQTPQDRIIWFMLRKSSFTGYLVCALTGRHANVYLLDAQQRLLRSLRPDHQVVGQPYTVPTPPSKRGTDQTKPCKTETTTWADQARERFSTSPFPLSQEIEDTFRLLEEKQEVERQTQLAQSHLRKAIQKTKRRIDNWNRDLEHVSRYQEFKRYGELLKGHLHEMSKGQHHITVIDYYDETLPELTLPLDPEKDHHGNLEDYFKKYRKYTGAKNNIIPRIEKAERELVDLQKALKEVESSGMTLPPQNVKTLSREKQPKRIPSTVRKPVPYRRFLSEDGNPILVGKTAKDNDTLTFRVSKQDDWWLHARGTPGSHVIIQMEKKQPLSPEALKDAATLALFYSDLRKSGKGEVIYTLRKNVRKPKDAKPGSVTVTQEKTMWVYLDQTRLDRLKNSGST